MQDGVHRTTRRLRRSDGEVRHAQLTFAPVPGGWGRMGWTTATLASLSRDELVTLARNSFTGSFLAPDEIAAHLAEIERYVASST